MAGAHRGARPTIFVIVVAVSALLVIIWAAIASSVVASRRHALNEARATVRNLAIGFREEVSSFLRVVDGDMQLMADGMRRDGAGFDLYTWGKTSALVSLGLERAVIVGTDGKLKAARFEPHPSPIDLSDRDYFRVGPDGTSLNQASEI